jgi:methylenetetrahydrofolate reductase (NADH)
MRLKNKFDTEQFAVLAEIEPPKGVDVDHMAKCAGRVKGLVDAFVVPEMSSAVMRMSALGGAMVLQNMGLETIMQVCCRDRNRIALQADLLAASACGINNIMAVTGQDPSFGDHHQARSVYDIDLTELLQMTQTLQQGRDMAGVDLAGTPQFLVGTTITAGAKGKSPAVELEEMNKKVEAGARFFITPPLFDLDELKKFISRVDREKTIIIPTVLLLKSLGMARYMNRNVEHVYIPDAMIDRIKKSTDKVKECVSIAREFIMELREEGLSGVYLVTMGWEHKLPEILE